MSDEQLSHKQKVEWGQESRTGLLIHNNPGGLCEFKPFGSSHIVPQAPVVKDARPVHSCITDALFSVRTGHTKDGVKELVCSLTILQANHIWFPFADCLTILSAQPETVWHCRYFFAHLSARQIIIYSVAKLVFYSFFYTL